MSFIIRNIDTVNVSIDDIGITLVPGENYDLTQDEPDVVAQSADLPAAITGGSVRVLDPLDGVTVLSPTESLTIVSAHNDPHYRIRGGVLNQLDDVTVTSPTVSSYLRYNGSSWVNLTAAAIGDFVHLTGDEDVAGEKRFTDSVRIGGSTVADLQITFNGPDGPAAGYVIRQIGLGSPQIFPGTLFFMDTAQFPQILMGSDSAGTVAGFIDVDNNGVLNLNALHTGAVVIGPGGLLPDDPDTPIGSSTDPWGTIHLDDEVRFYEETGTDYVAFAAPASITSSVTWTLPAVDSTGTQALVSDGAGTLSWSNVITSNQNLWETINADAGSTSANTTTDTLTISGGTGISTAISGDTLTITNDAPNVDQNLWETFNADSGSTSANTTTDTFTFTGGTGISTSISGDIVTITNTSPNVDQSLFQTIAVATQNNVVADSPTDTLTLVAGTGISITTNDTTDTITFTSNVTSSDLASVVVGLTSSIAIPTTYANISWPTTHVENNTSVIEHDNTNTDRILIKETGLYFIHFNISFDADAGEETVEARVLVDDTTTVPGSHRLATEDDEINDLSNGFTAELTTGTYLTLQHQASGTGNVLHNSSNFSVTRAKGSKGEKGDPGSGTTITVEEDDVEVGMVDTVNFEGNGVSVTGEGSPLTKATITINRDFLHRHNGATTQTLTGAPVTILFGTNVRTDTGNYTYSAGQVTIVDAGWYRITFDATADGTTNTRSVGRFFLENNTTLVTGSNCYTYNRQNAEGENTASSTVLINASASDVIRVRGQLFNGSNIVTVANACRLTIESLGL